MALQLLFLKIQSIFWQTKFFKLKSFAFPTAGQVDNLLKMKSLPLPYLAGIRRYRLTLCQRLASLRPICGHGLLGQPKYFHTGLLMMLEELCECTNSEYIAFKNEDEHREFKQSKKKQRQ